LRVPRPCETKENVSKTCVDMIRAYASLTAKATYA
jgi:hypothetical protein